MTWLFDPPAPVALAILGRDARFPVRRILCVGQNYAAHAREMGADPARETPFFFSKPRDALITEADVPFPSATENLHHEVELVCAIGGEGADLAPGAAADLIIGWAVGVRPDPPRHPGRGQGPGAALGRVQGVRPFRPLRPPDPGRPAELRRGRRPDRERPDPPVLPSGPDDLEPRRGGGRGLTPLAAHAGRPDLHRHARGRRSCRARRPDRGDDRGAGAAGLHPDLKRRTMILHGYWRSGTSYRTRIALNLKGLTYAQAGVDLRTGAQKSDAYLSMNPQGLVPALETDGAVLTQSPAILEWLEETHPAPPLLPREATARARVRAMAALVACDIHPLNNLRVAQGPARNLRRRPGRHGRLGRPLDHRRIRGAGGPDRPARRRLVLRRRAHPGGLLPDPAGLFGAAVQHAAGRLSPHPGHRGKGGGAPRISGRAPGPPAGR